MESILAGNDGKRQCPVATADELRELVNKGFEAVSIEIESDRGRADCQIVRRATIVCNYPPLKVGEIGVGGR